MKYKCKKCSYSTSNESEIQRHIANAHRSYNSSSDIYSSGLQTDYSNISSSDYTSSSDSGFSGGGGDFGGGGSNGDW